MLSREIMERLNVPPVHWQACMSAIPNTVKYKATIAEYLENVCNNCTKLNKGLLLWGEYSTGKSAIAAMCLKAAACKGIIGYWIRAEMIPTYRIENTRFDAEQTVYERCLSVPLLVIDELILRTEMKYTEYAAEELLRCRVDARKCTIVTTNKSIADLQTKWPSLIAVMQECIYPVKISGKDFRKEIGKTL